MTGEYVPEAADVIWADFDPRVGHEQSGHRPAVVISPRAYNARSGLLICCPMTTRSRGYPFEYRLAGVAPSVVLTDHVRSIDWRARGAARNGSITAIELTAIRQRVIGLIGS